MSYEFLNHGERVLDDRIFFHYRAIGITPAMAGEGSVYGFTATESEGRYLDGGKTYKVHMSSPVPAKDFWSFIV